MYPKSRKHLGEFSSPTALAPITISEDGSVSRSMAEVLSKYPTSASPGIGAAQGDAPVVITSFAAVTWRPSARVMDLLDVTVACCPKRVTAS